MTDKTLGKAARAVTTKLSYPDWRRFKSIARAQQVSMSELVRRIVREWLGQEKAS